MDKLNEEKPFVSIIIPTWRESEILNRCLRSLFEQDYPKDRFEVILVSKEKIVIERLDRKGIRVSLIEKDLNPAQARNEAAKIAQGEILAFIDDDCLVPKDWISKAVKYLDREEIGLIGGPAIPFKNEPFRYRLAGYLVSSFFVSGFLGNRHKILSSAHQSNDYDLILANNFVRKTSFEKVGGFDKDQFPAEDYDLYFKLKKAGYKMLYVPEIFVWHKAKPIFLPWAGKVFYYATGRGVLMARRLETIKPVFFIPTIFFLAFVSFFFFSFFLKKFFVLWRIIIFLYFFWNIIGAFYIFFKNEKNFLVLVYSPLATFLVHCSYGLGILYGFYKYISGGYKGGIRSKSKY
jgi:GT2 family glycosyltransferase